MPLVIKLFSQPRHVCVCAHTCIACVCIRVLRVCVHACDVCAYVYVRVACVCVHVVYVCVSIAICNLYITGGQT